MEIFEQAWAWLGREVAEFGIRWIIVGVLMLGFFRWLNEKDVARIRRHIEKAKKELAEGDIPVVSNWSLDGRAVTYSTTRGPLKIRFDNVHTAHEDIDAWLEEKRLYSHSAPFKWRAADDHEYPKDDTRNPPSLEEHERLMKRYGKDRDD